MTMMEELAATPMETIMHAEPLSVPMETPLGEAVEKMQGKYGAILVEKDGQTVGIFTERDLMMRVDHSGSAWRELPIGEVMTSDMRTLSASDTLSHAISLMSEGVFRHVPIMKDGHAVGIVSIRDILSYAVHQYPKEFINLPPGPNSEASGPWGG